MTMEEVLESAYSMSYPGDEAMPPACAGLQEGMREAPSREEALMNPLLDDDTLYYAFFKEAAQKAQVTATDMDRHETIARLDMDAVQEMWRSQVEYPRIIRCLSATSRYQGLTGEQRWMMAAGFVTNAVNPVLNEPWIAAAKPVIRLDALSPSADLYGSFLKAVWEKQPRMRLAEAERKCVQAMHRSGFSENVIAKAWEECSLQFPKPEHPDIDAEKELSPAEKNALADYEQAWKIRRGEMETFLQDALKEQEPERSKPANEPAYMDMQEKLKGLKSSHETGDLLEYWQKAIQTMQEALLQVEQAKNTCKVLALWSIGLEKASKELGQEMSPEIREMQEKLKKVMEKVEEQDKDWDFIYRMISKVDTFTKHLIQSATEKRERSPLLKLPEIQHAPPLAQILEKGEKAYAKDYHKILYYAAIREAALKKDGLTAETIDREAARELIRHKAFQVDIGKALAHSPAIRDLPPGERILPIHRIIQSAQPGASEQPERGGGRT